MAASDYISPVGELNVDLFPGVEDLTAHVEQVVAHVPSGYDADQTEAWVYHRLYSDAVLRLATRAEQYSEDGQASVRYSSDALAEARAQKAIWKDVLDDALDVADTGSVVQNRTTSRRVRTVW